MTYKTGDSVVVRHEQLIKLGKIEHSSNVRKRDQYYVRLEDGNLLGPAFVDKIVSASTIDSKLTNKYFGKGCTNNAVIIPELHIESYEPDIQVDDNF